ncbi:MAG: TerB family tellurite resistance protein [Flavobacteriales bacterium]|nr:TerB family tellurite resistance protein [Flavobacteriales bacterium]
MSYSKWIAGGLGWAFGGPIGGILGFAIGALVDGVSGTTTTGQRAIPPPRGSAGQGQTTQGDLALSLVVLSAAMMRADGRVTKAELDLARSFFRKQFGEPNAQQMILMLRDALNQEIPLQQVCEQVRGHMPHSARLQLLHFLIGLAHADGSVAPSEIEMVRRIAHYLYVSEKDLASLSAMFGRATPDRAYQILEVDPKASDEEVKKAYRRAAMKHHPDKVGHLGEEVQRSAAEKFKKVQDAWEQVRKARGIN